MKKFDFEPKGLNILKNSIVNFILTLPDAILDFFRYFPICKIIGHKFTYSQNLYRKCSLCERTEIYGFGKFGRRKWSQLYRK